MSTRISAAQALIKSLRTGEYTASVALGMHLAQDVVLEANGPMPGMPSSTTRGHADVLRRLSGNWAVTMALRHARWSSPVAEGDTVKVSVTFEHLGGIVPAALSVTAG